MDVSQCSLSRFLSSYSPDRFEWEDPDFCPRTRFLWSRPLSNAPLLCHPYEDYLSDDLFVSRQASKAASRVDDDSESSLSDMSVSVSSGSLRHSTPRDSPGFTSSFALLDRQHDFALHELDSRMKISLLLCDDNDIDGNLCAKMLDWILSLFVDVAGSLMDSEVPVSQPCREACGLSVVESPTTVTPSYDASLLGSPHSIIKLPRHHGPHLPLPSPRSLKSLPSLVSMPGSDKCEPLTSEETTTAKQVCMWGRRLERIPKVRVPGQKEAVYCFDARKQRQKQAPAQLRPFPSPVTSRPTRSQPTQIFYRARPLNRPFAGLDNPDSLCRTPIDGVKVTQGRVLLQNVSPVRFDVTPTPSPRALNVVVPGLCPCTPAIPSRMPFGPRTNSFGSSFNMAFQPGRQGHPQPIRIKSYQGTPFVDTLRGRPL